MDRLDPPRPRRDRSPEEADVLRRALVALLFLAPLVPTAPAATAGEWWGPSAGMLDGWHIRVPVVVKNTAARTVTDAVVGYDLDLAKALLEAGWTSGRQGNERRLQAFELDERSIRVVEYLSLDAGSPVRGLLASNPEMPAQVRTGFLDRTSGYNNRTQPDVHIDWVARGDFPAGATRAFMIYADVRAYGDKPEPGYSREGHAALDAHRWITRGTTLVGRATTLQLVGLEDDTHALVEAYAGGRPVPITVSSGSALGNPIALKRGQVVLVDLSATPILVRITSDKPVVAAGSAAPVGFVPSLDRGLLGRSFVFTTNIGYAVLTPAGAASFTITRTGGTAPGESKNSLPVQSMRVFDGQSGGTTRIESDVPILVQAWPNAQARVQLVTPQGTPLGSRLVGIALSGGHGNQFPPDGLARPPGAISPCSSSTNFLISGETRVHTFDADAWVRGRDYLSGQVLHPRGDAGQPSRTSARVTPASPYVVTFTNADQCPLVVHASLPESDVITDTATLFGTAGAAAPFGVLATPYAGRNATSFLTYDNLTLVALHNGTSVTVHRAQGAERPVGLAEGDAIEIPARSDRWARIDATKPVLAIGEGVGGFFAGLDESLVVTRAGRAEYRGYLVSVEPSGDAAEPMIGVAAPGKPATYKLTVKNLARDARGGDVPDTVRLSVSPLPEGWTAHLSDASLRLQGGEAREITLVVSPPADAEEGTSVTLSVTASSDALPAMTDRLPLVTLVRARYGVDLWLDREGGPKSRTLVFEEGQDGRLTVVVKNLASVEDRILLAATPLSPEWRTTFETSGAALAEVSLAPGETRAVALAIRAPTDGGSQSLLDVTATSLSDASAAAKVAAGLRMRSDARIALDADVQALEALPGAEARFRLTFRNLGSEAVGIEFNTTGALPEGWARPHTYHGEHEIDELEGLLPGSVTSLDLVAKVPEGALRGDIANLHFVVRTLPRFVGDAVLRESIDLRVLVAADHRLRVVDAANDVVADETGLATARIEVHNGGNLVETLRPRPVDLPLGASFSTGAPPVIPRNGTGSLIASVHLPPTAAAGTYRAQLELVADDGTSFPWRVNVTLLPRARVEIEPQSPARATAGVPVLAAFEIRNVGNVPVALPPRLVLPEDWDVSWGNITSTEIPPGGAAAVQGEIRIPRTAPAGVVELRPDPQWADGSPLAWDVRTVVLRAETLDRASPTVRVQNEGTGDARDVVVELVDGGVTRDRVVLGRIPPGGSGLAVLVPPPGGSRDVTLRVDAEARYNDAPAELQVRVEGGRDLPWGVPLVLLAALFAAFIPRRRPPP